jgi:uncharacterized protein involved in exopolysaccharide biosynthesis
LFANANGQTGILSLTVTAQNEDLSLALVHAIYEETADYYIETSIERQKATYNLIKAKRDSLEAMLRARESGLASFMDKNRSLIQYQAQLPRERMTKEMQVLSTVLVEAIRNLEVADFTLKNQTPYIQALDMPFPPLDPVRPPVLTTVLMAACGGVLLGLLITLGRHYWKQIA